MSGCFTIGLPPLTESIINQGWFFLIAFEISKFIIYAVLKPNASEFETCKKGIWIQIKKDDEFRGDGIGDCLDGGSKKKDCFYLLLSGIGTLDATAEQDAQVGFQCDASSIQYLDIQGLRFHPP